MLISDLTLTMPIPDFPSLSYGTTEKEIYEFRVDDKEKLWEELGVRVKASLAKSEFSINTINAKDTLEREYKKAPQVREP